MTFVGTSFAKKDDKAGLVTGNLTLLGVTKPVTLEVTFNRAGVRASDRADAIGFSARGSLNAVPASLGRLKRQYATPV
jgi:polyisoprenoid-binding protein YceI